MEDAKYFKPLSLTWWAAVVPLGLGVFIATEPVHGLTEWVAAARNLTGGASPAVLINLGLFGIGIRGAPGVSGVLGGK